MADDATSTKDAQTTDDKDGQKDGQQQTQTDIDQIASQAQNPDAVKNALTAERQAAKEARERADGLAAKVKKFEDADKSQQEKLEERATTAEANAKKSELQALRLEVALDKKLPRTLADRLQGETKKQLEEDADRLLELMKPEGKPTGDADAGKGEGGAGQSFNDQLRQKIRR